MFNITDTNLTIMVKNMPEALRFYQDVLGMKVLRQYGEHYAQVGAPGIIIGLHPSDKGENTSENLSIGFTVDDFEKAKSHLEGLGVYHYQRKEEGGSFIHFKDPDGTPLYFVIPKSVTG